jgi:hypothetical protein
MKLEYKGFILHKNSEYFPDCADNIAYKHYDSNKLIKFAIADGISKSFLPKIWSRNLVDEYVLYESIDYDFVKIAESAQQKWENEFKFKKSEDEEYILEICVLGQSPMPTRLIQARL